MPRNLAFSLAFAGFVGTTACGGDALTPARSAFRDGRLPAAAGELRALEGQAARFSPEQRARYALYRGLVELGLGNAAAADRWLSSAKRALARDPACLDAAERGQLLAAWRSTGRLPGETP